MFSSRISIKIGLWYAIAFFLSACVLFAVTGFVLVNSLETKDHELLNDKLEEYSILYGLDGVSGLRLRVSAKEIKNAREYVVRLAGKDNQTIFIHSPDRSNDANAPQLQDIDEFLSKTKIKDGWKLIPAEDFGDSVEIVSKTLPSGEVLQVGKDTEDREEFFRSFTQAYVKGLIPVFVLSIFLGMILSRRMLKPIRRLTRTVESIRSGDSKARVRLHKEKDELWQLGHLFNQMLEENEHLMQGMRETIDNVAHDLRTPIMRLQNAVESAIFGEATLFRFENALIDCKENSDLLLKLVEGILDISEAQAGTLRLKLEKVSSTDLFHGVVDLYAFVAEDKNITIKVSEINRFEMLGDKMRLLQIVSNLIDNAIKYSPSNTTIILESSVTDGTGVIKVIDQGVGISPFEQEKIWERLYRTDASRSSRVLGLGLSLVKAMVNAHGGTVAVRSDRASMGSTFILKFPQSIFLE